MLCVMTAVTGIFSNPVPVPQKGFVSGPTTHATDHTKSKGTVGTMLTVQSLRMSCQILN